MSLRTVLPLLQRACAGGHEPVARALIDHVWRDYDSDDEGESELRWEKGAVLEGCLAAAARGGHTAVARMILESDSLWQEEEIVVDEEILYAIRASGDVDMWQLMNMGTCDEVWFRPPHFYTADERAAKKLIDEKGPLQLPIALHVTRQIGSALEHARTCDIIHRDVKPSNVLLGTDDGKCVLYPTESRAFAVGWGVINGKRAPWESNPWVWAISFQRLS